MKNNVVKFILSLSIILISLASFAQQRGKPGTPEGLATHQTARMKEVLKLSADQEASVADINLKYAI